MNENMNDFNSMNDFNNVNDGAGESSNVQNAQKVAESIGKATALLLPVIKSFFRKLSQSMAELDNYKISETVNVSYLKKFRKEKNSQVIIANIGSMIDNMPQNAFTDETKNKMSSLGDEFIIAEYDKINEKVINVVITDSTKISPSIFNLLENNEGMIVVED